MSNAMVSHEPKSKHPNRQQLSDFINGQLSSKHQSVVERHVEKCPRCVNALSGIEGDGIGGDTLSNRLVAVATFFDNAIPLADEDEVPVELRDHPRYEIREKIGRGGMGDVFHARQRSMDRPVAVKVMRKNLFENQRAVARFRNEIKLAARLNHPNIVHSYDADVEGDSNMLVMELVVGNKLSDLVTPDLPLPVKRACQIVFEIAMGLRYAYSEGMIHRDIKPQNIMVLDDGSVKITDFGLGKFLFHPTQPGGPAETDCDLTQEGEVFGTPDYIAPEQIRDSRSVDGRSDIYSLGCTFYFLLTGHAPFAERSVGEKLAGHLENNPQPIGAIRPDVSPDVVTLVTKMMEKTADARFQDYDQLLDAIQPLLANPGVPTGTSATVTLPVELAKPDFALAGGPPIPADHPLAHEKSRTTKRPQNVVWKIATGFLGFFLLAAALFQTGWIPSPFFAPATPTEKIKLAIVIPATDAWHPEIHELEQFFLSQPNVEVEYISERTGSVTFRGHNRETKDPTAIHVQRTLADISAAEFSAIIFTGGWNGTNVHSTRYAFDPSLTRDAKIFIEEMLRQKKPVGAICGGITVLANAGILKNVRVANCRYLPSEVQSRSEAIWSPVPETDEQATTIVDGLIVTGGNSINCAEVGEQLLKQIRTR